MDTYEMRNTLANLIGTHRPRKGDVWKAVRSMVESAAAADLDDNEALGDLATVYAYFRPAPPKRPWSGWDWLASAINPTDRREAIRHIQVTTRGACGTNGHRIHWLPLSALPTKTPAGVPLEPGLYLPTGERASCTDGFPDVSPFAPGEDSWPAKHVGMRDGRQDSAGVEFVAEVFKASPDSGDSGEKYFNSAYVQAAMHRGDPAQVALRHAPVLELLHLTFADGGWASIAAIRV